MAEYVKISPLTRLEGHLGITARVNDVDGVPSVSAAYSHGEMFRGLEKILIKRDPRDAPVITSRTCGVCHFVHRHTSLRAIENAAGFAFPMPQAADADSWDNGKLTGDFPGYLYSGEDGNKDPRWLDKNRDKKTGTPDGKNLPVGAQLARNIVHLITFVYSHAAHTIALAAPDYKYYIDKYVSDNETKLSDLGFDTSQLDGSFFDAFYKEAVVAQRVLHEILGFLGGKVPHQQSAIPGGFSRSFRGQLTDGDSDMDAIAALAGKQIPIAGNPDKGGYPLLDLSLDGQRTITGLDPDGGSATQGGDWITARAGLFTIALAVGGVLAGAHKWGEGSNNFVCAPTFDMIQGTAITGDAYFRGGVKTADGWYMLDPTKYGSDGSGWMFIYEDITSGKYAEYDKITEEPKCGGTADYPTLGYPGDNDTHPASFTHGLGDRRYTYTWYKATRAATANPTGDGSDLTLYTVESGPFARLVVNGCDPHLNLGGLNDGSEDLPLPDGSGGYFYPKILAGTGLRAVIESVYGGVGAWQSSTWNRLIGRVQDILLLIDMLIGSNYSGENYDGTYTGYLKEIANETCWLNRLNTVLGNGNLTDDRGALDASVLVDESTAWENLDGQGCGYWDAPRGITCHFCKVEDGFLTQYQHIAGTTWNGNGRDQQGNPGPFEWSLMGMNKVTDVDLVEKSGGKWEVTLGNTPVCERTVLISYKLAEGSGGDKWKEYTAIDVPKHKDPENDEEYQQGRIKGVGLGDSYIDYVTGDIVLQFKSNADYPDYGHVKEVKVERYGYGDNPVPTPPTWADEYGGYGYSADTEKPNPINILRTIRSYDPCLACSVHVVDKEGREGKYEAVPMAGWDPK